MRVIVIFVALLIATPVLAAQEPAIKVQETEEYIQIDTDAIPGEDSPVLRQYGGKISCKDAKAQR